VAGFTLLQESKYCWLPFLQIHVYVSQCLLGNCRRHRCCNLKFVSCKSFSCLFVASFLSWSAARWTWHLSINHIPIKIKSCFLPVSLVLYYPIESWQHISNTPKHFWPWQWCYVDVHRTKTKTKTISKLFFTQWILKLRKVIYKSLSFWGQVES